MSCLTAICGACRHWSCGCRRCWLRAGASSCSVPPPASFAPVSVPHLAACLPQDDKISRGGAHRRVEVHHMCFVVAWVCTVDGCARQMLQAASRAFVSACSCCRRPEHHAGAAGFLRPGAARRVRGEARSHVAGAPAPRALPRCVPRVPPRQARRLGTPETLWVRALSRLATAAIPSHCLLCSALHMQPVKILTSNC